MWENDKNMENENKNQEKNQVNEEKAKRYVTLYLQTYIGMDIPKHGATMWIKESLTTQFEKKENLDYGKNREQKQREI